MSINVLVIGKNSLLANCFKKYSRISKVKYIHYKKIKQIKFDKFSHIINFSIEPDNFKKNYLHTNKIDKKICKLIQNSNCIYVFPSSRLVYNKSKENYYGRNKKETEKDIKKIKKKFLILRISTLLTFDVSNRNLFISKALKSLKKNNQIEIDISKSTYKDFITSKILIYVLDNLLINEVIGTYNLSSNIPIKVIDIFKSLIKGFGKGKIIFKKKLKKNHSFVLNNTKLKEKVRFKLLKKDILDYCIELGKKLNA